MRELGSIKAGKGVKRIFFFSFRSVYFRFFFFFLTKSNKKGHDARNGKWQMAMDMDMETEQAKKGGGFALLTLLRFFL